MQLSLSQTPKSISSANYLLRQYGGAAAAYSLQRLDTSTTNVVRARRSTDDAESNFTAEEVSGGSLREFALNNDADLIRFADQAAAADKRMYFDGVNDYVDFGIGDPLGFDGAGKITLAFKLVVGVDPAARAYLFRNAINGGSTGISISLETNGTIRAQGRSVLTDLVQGATSTSVITEGAINEIEVYLDFANDEIGININSGGYETTAVTFGNASYTYGLTVNRTTLGAFLLLAGYGAGVIYDFSVSKDDVLSSSYQGYGNTNADWTDQVGSNDGTVSGSPALFSGQGFDAYVTTLYDQSGNGRNATQATAASQPQIVADGVVVTDATGKPAIDFDGINDTYTIPDQGALTSFGMWAVASYSGGDGAAKGIFSPSVNGGSFMMLARNSTTGAKWGTFGTTARPANSDFTAISLLGMVSSDGESGTFYKDGSSDGTFADTIGQTPHIGGKATGQQMQGKISEIIYYDTDQSSNRSAIEANIASRYGITI